MKRYPANKNYGTHMVRVKWQIDDFVATGIALMGGNCSGATILESVLSEFEDGFEPRMIFPENKKHFEIDDDGYLKTIKLFDPEGNETSFDEPFFHDYIVGVEIVDFESDN
jgi:hypothetical protein